MIPENMKEFFLKHGVPAMLQERYRCEGNDCYELSSTGTEKPPAQSVGASPVPVVLPPKPCNCGGNPEAQAAMLKQRQENFERWQKLRKQHPPAS